MLEATRPYGAPVRPFLSPLVHYQLAREAWQQRGYWALRREVFCREQALFASPLDERDVHDAHALPLVAIAHAAGTPFDVVGVVRIYEAEPGVWYGGRLAVAAGYRAHGRVGKGLIEAAVGCAKARGCRRFLATVLAENAAYFARRHFVSLEPRRLCGRAHVLMQAQLEAFGALAAGSGARQPA